MALKLHEWELVSKDPHDPDNEGHNHTVHRMRVPGGWLYKIRRNGFMTFVPDPNNVISIKPF
jgi:hypothetical protein